MGRVRMSLDMRTSCVFLASGSLCGWECGRHGTRAGAVAMVTMVVMVERKTAFYSNYTVTCSVPQQHNRGRSFLANNIETSLPNAVHA